MHSIENKGYLYSFRSIPFIIPFPVCIPLCMPYLVSLVCKSFLSLPCISFLYSFLLSFQKRVTKKGYREGIRSSYIQGIRNTAYKEGYIQGIRGTASFLLRYGIRQVILGKGYEYSFFSKKGYKERIIPSMEKILSFWLQSIYSYFSYCMQKQEREGIMRRRDKKKHAVSRILKDKIVYLKRKDAVSRIPCTVFISFC